MPINSIKKYIENNLSILKGKKIRQLRRMALMIGVDFGEDIEYKNSDNQIETKICFSLHIHSSWRLLKNGEICVGQSDLFNRDIGGFMTYECDDKSIANVEFTRISRKLNEIFKTEEIKVTEVEANELGDLKIYMENNYRLEIFVDAFEDAESWRFFRTDNDSKHIVIFSED